MDPFDPRQPQNRPPFQSPPPYRKPELPNATAVLILGIVSLVFVLSGCLFVFTAFVSLITGIVGLSLAGTGMRMHRENPMGYEGYNNLNAGRIMCIVSLVLTGIGILGLIMYFLFVGAVVVNSPIFMQ